MNAATIARCAGCGRAARAEGTPAFRCEHGRSDFETDHLIEVRPNYGMVRWPSDEDANPFVRYRTLLHSYHVARAGGLSDETYIGLVRELDERVAAIDGRRFVVTPLAYTEGLSAALRFEQGSGLLVKDETNNVGGSHKARHLMGLAIYLRIIEALNIPSPKATSELAIASCGNAALAAAIVARALGRVLRVFVPPEANPAVLTQLAQHGAQVESCARVAGGSGDPTFERLQQVVADGAVPFTCQGTLNGLTIDGGKTLGFEMVDALQRAGTKLDRVFVQVGGGALGSGLFQAFRDAQAMGILERLPRLHMVQPETVHPLAKAYSTLVERLPKLGIMHRMGSISASAMADAIVQHWHDAQVERRIRYAIAHRSQFMAPWPTPPKSIATGIIDDVTYDWASVLRAMLATGGYPVLVSETALENGHATARAHGESRVCVTGAAGFSGLMSLRAEGDVGAHEKVAVLFTGVER